jgi:uncharacterized Ntn-hydrolase superfamily protein
MCPGMLGVAVASATLGVGGICPFIAPGVGAISTQSFVNPYLGIDGLALLRKGKVAQEALEELIRGDPGGDVRQLGIVDALGNSAAWSGPNCLEWFGHRTGPNFAAQGNVLVGRETVESMAETFNATSHLTLPERLLAALEAGESAGGDKRGRQAASLVVYRTEEYPYLSLRVDEHPYPVPELRRVFELARNQLLPFVEGLPSRRNPMGNVPQEVVDMLLSSPPLRPGGGGSSL